MVFNATFSNSSAKPPTCHKSLTNFIDNYIFVVYCLTIMSYNSIAYYLVCNWRLRPLALVVWLVLFIIQLWRRINNICIKSKIRNHDQHVSWQSPSHSYKVGIYWYVKCTCITVSFHLEMRLYCVLR